MQGSAQGGEADVLKCHLGCLFMRPASRINEHTKVSIVNIVSISGKKSISVVES